MESKNKGLYQKYKVERHDGKEITMGSFVLELKDPHARTAILAYADSLEKAGLKKDLVYDLKSWVSKYQNIDDDKKTMLFNRIVCVKNDQIINAGSIYVINPADKDEHVQLDDIAMEAVLTINTQPYHDYKNAEKAHLNSKEYKALQAVAKFVINEFMDKPEYESIDELWKDNKDFYTQTFNQDPETLWEEINTQFEKD